ncbi:MAG: DUF1538 domain-containing protein [Clostridia bacterium]|nr:DUF1538 domain-containing protein [Clostridia bacterium]
MDVLKEKFREVFFSVLPVTLIVLVLHFTIAPIESPILLRFLIGAFFIIIGLTIFLVGIDFGITPLGNLMGSKITQTNKIWIVITSGLVVGFLIAIAEPNLHVLAGQLETVTSGALSKGVILLVVSIGVALMIALGWVRTVYKVPLYKLLTIFYGLIFALALFNPPEFLAIAFDSSGSVTGALVVPFILALAIGISSSRKDSKASEVDSFGLVAMAAAGPIISVLIMNIVSKGGGISGDVETAIKGTNSLLLPFLEITPQIITEVAIALLPMLLLFVFFQRVLFKLPKRSVYRILKSLFLTFIGLVLFLVGVNAGFMGLGRILGQSLAALGNKYIVVIVGFFLGLVVILAEPAVHVLTQQIEDVTSGHIKGKIVLATLSIGVGVAVCLSMIRIIVPKVQLWHYLLPGYFIAIVLSYIVPPLFVGMAFDSGAVSSGPMSATFILAFTQGVAAQTVGANVLIDGFGMLAVVTMAPIVALQVLGLIFKLQTVKGGVNVNVRQSKVKGS